MIDWYMPFSQSYGLPVVVGLWTWIGRRWILFGGEQLLHPFSTDYSWLAQSNF